MPEQAPVGAAEINGAIEMCACGAGRTHVIVLPPLIVYADACSSVERKWYIAPIFEQKPSLKNLFVHNFAQKFLCEIA